MAVQRKDILNNFFDVLKTISIVNGYHTDVKEVERVLRHWDDVTRGDRPWIGFMPGLETFQYLPGAQIRVILPFQIMAYVAHEGERDDVDDRLSALQDDIIVVLNKDTTRGGCAVSTTITGSATDEGEQNGSGIVKVDGNIVYFRTTGVS